MALVSYSDSEASDSEPTPVTKKPASQQPKADKSKGEGFQPLVDRGNPRKIRVNLGDAGTSGADDAADEDAERARKRPRVGEGGGAFSGFNSFLPAPKRAAQAKGGSNTRTDNTASARKPFSLKTGAAPGFDRSADAETRVGLGSNNENEEGEKSTNGAASSASESTPGPGIMANGEKGYQKKGNAMMFKPLSVSRNPTRKKARATATASTTTSADKSQLSKPITEEKPAPAPAAPPKKKISLFGLSSEEDTTPSEPAPQRSATYEPLIYNAPDESVLEASHEASEDQQQAPLIPQPTDPAGPQSLASVANDLNLSDSQMRQLFGRKGRGGDATGKVITFNTDEEYKSNAEYLSRMSAEELAAQQHNPVRAVAPGKHSLQQLVNQVTNQRDALEESFAAGKRNKKEAGARYGW